MRVPKKEYEIFKKECLRLQKEWGLLDWEISFAFEPLEGKLAVTMANLKGRKATITLSSVLPDEVNEIRDTVRSAKHEMVHLLLWRFSTLAGWRCVSDQELEEAEEALVIQLVKLIE